MFKKFFAIVLTTLALTAIQGCNKESGNGEINGKVETNIVTLVSTGDEGSVFTFRELNDSPEITLTTPQKFNTSIKPGTRLALSYIPENGEASQSGSIRVISFLPCYGPTITVGNGPSDWQTSSVFMAAMWRSGKWLNFQMVLNIVSQARRLALVLDEATADTSVPELHISFSPDNSSNALPQTAYASFDISELWDNPRVEALKIYFLTADGQETSFTLQKETNGFKPAE